MQWITESDRLKNKIETCKIFSLVSILSSLILMIISIFIANGVVYLSLSALAFSWLLKDYEVTYLNKLLKLTDKTKNIDGGR